MNWEPLIPAIRRLYREVAGGCWVSDRARFWYVDDGKRCSISMRALLALLTGKTRAKHHVIVRVCGNGACIRPGKGHNERHARSAMGVMTRQRKLTDDQVRAIREDPRSSAELARVYAVNASTIQRIKLGTRKAGVPDQGAAPVKEAAE